VPPAAVHEDGKTSTRHHKVRRASVGEVTMEAKPTAFGMKSSAKQQLWQGMFLAPPS
jgi:hypothetical protein